MFAVVLNSYHSLKVLDAIQNTPGIRWNAGIPEHFKDMTRSQIRMMLNPIAKYANATKVKYFGAPKSFDWTSIKPECLMVRD